MKLNPFYKRHREFIKEADKQAEKLRKLQEKQERECLERERKQKAKTT